MSTNVFALPDLGEGLTEAELVRWLVSAGDNVAVDTPLAEVETAKATVEVPSPYGGVVSELHSREGDTIAVGAPMVSFTDDADLPGTETDTPGSQASGHSGPVLIGYGVQGTAPSRRRRLPAAGSESLPGSAISPPEDELAPPSARPAVQSPAVRNLAHSSGLDLTTVPGTGPDGLITRQDVEQAAQLPAGRLTGTDPTDNWSDPAWHEAQAVRLGSGSPSHQSDVTAHLARAQLHATLAVALRLRRVEKTVGQ